MLKSLLQTMNMCYDKNIESKNIEFRLEQIKELSPRSEWSTNKNIIKEQSHQMKLKEFNIFGINDQEVKSMNSFMQSPKFAERNELVIRSSDKIINASNLETFCLQNLTESSTRSIEENSGLLKERRERFFFSVKDINSSEIPDKNCSTDNTAILDSEIAKAKKLILEDVSGELLFKQVLKIDANGLGNGLRKKKDGYVFFGPVEAYKNCVINDFVINYNKELCSRLFVLLYDKNQQKYYIRNINDKKDNLNPIYVKVTKPILIKSKQYFSFGQVILSVNPISNSKENKGDKFTDSIKVIIYDNMKNKLVKENISTFYFNSSHSPVLIGRDNCTINVDLSSLSKKQCKLEYNRTTECWVLTDGFCNRPSTNGTWLLINSKYEINEELFVKIGKDVLKINIV